MTDQELFFKYVELMKKHKKQEYNFFLIKILNTLSRTTMANLFTKNNLKYIYFPLSVPDMQRSL